MKRTLLPLITLLVALTGTAQTIGEAFYVYRSDGEFNAFLREEVDSIAYSCYDADSLYYGDFVTQIVYTADSTYWIPLASIDSVSFVTPETKYTPHVVKLEPLLPYIVSVDGMQLTFSSDMPSNLFPRTEDILVLDNFDHEQFPTGFAGRIAVKDGLQITCDSVSFEDIYEQIICYGYYMAIDDSSSTENRRVRFAAKRKVGGNISNAISINGTLGSRETGIFASVNGRLGMDLRFTFKYRKGEPTYFDISLTPELTFNFEAGAEGTLSLTIPPKDPDAPLLILPLPNIPFYFKLTGTPVLEAYLKASIVVRTEAKLGEKLGIKYVNGDFKSDCGKTSKRLSRPDLTGSIEGNLFVGLKDRFGVSSYGDVVSAVIEKKAGVEFDASLTGNITNPDLLSYDELKDDYFDVNLKASAAFKAEAKLFKWFKLSAKYDIFSGKFNVFKFRLVPSFTKPIVKLDKTSATVSVIPDDRILFPVFLGLGLWDENNSLLNVQYSDSLYSYYGINRTIDEYSATFTNLSLNKDYTVRPLVKLFGGTIVAQPEETFKIPITPVTLPVRNVTDISATARGRIDGHELLDETMKYGIAYIDVRTARNDTIWCEATTIGDDGVFSIEINSLKPQTTYRFFAYLIIDGETYSGTKRVFTTEEDTREAYYVWNGDYKTARYYYDHYCESRGGTRISSEHVVNRIDYAIQTVIFDSSFFEYHPKVFTFGNCSKLRVINNLIYLNTDNITDMCDMFSGCSSLKSLDLSNFNTSKVTRFGLSSYLQQCGMFSYCSSLTELNLKNFNISNANASDMRNMFRGCSSLTSVDLSSFYTSNVTCMENMFLGCSSLTSLDLSNFDTSNVQWMSSMFRGCSSLTSIDVSSFDTYNASVSDMFRECSSLTVLDLSSFRFPAKGSINMGGMFRDCRSLRTIYAGNWDTSDTYSYDDPPFYGCPNLRGGQGTKVGDNIYGYDDKGNPLTYYVRSDRWIYARIDGGKDWPGLFTEK